MVDNGHRSVCHPPNHTRVIRALGTRVDNGVGADLCLTLAIG